MKKYLSLLITVFMFLSVFTGCSEKIDNESETSYSSDLEKSNVSALRDNSGISESGEDASPGNEQDDISACFTETVTVQRTNYYCIDTAEQLYAFANLVNTGKHDFDGEIVLLRKDIELNSLELLDDWKNNPPENAWTPIGSKEFPFKGKFLGGSIIGESYSGESKTISGIYCPIDESDSALFGNIEEAEISYITLGEGYI